MLVPILVVVAVIVIAVLLVVGRQPSKFRLERTATFASPASAAFAQVNDFHNWQGWSPWAKMDPTCKNEFSGAPLGHGAVFNWAGNKRVGAGRMTIIESKPQDLIRLKLEFFKPFVATNIAEFTFIPRGDSTIVTWSMTGERNFMSKAFCMFMNMEKIVGGEFEKGLADMKSLAEANAGR